ncbi:MAG: hypothetical protein PHX43_07025 [Alphaproteobacteria bacterium]|nr:hypothetical protein [Alphaproteobacteria bacterium]
MRKSSHDLKIKSGNRTVLSLVIAVAILLIPSSNAWAQTLCRGGCRTGNPVTSNLYLVYQNEVNIENVLKEKILPAIGETKAAIVASSIGMIEAGTRLVQAVIDNNLKQSLAKAQALIAVRKTTTTAGDNLLCHIVNANQLENITKIYADVLGDFLSRNTYDFAFKGKQEFVPGCLGPDAGHGNRCINGVEDSAAQMKNAQCVLKTGIPSDFMNNGGRKAKNYDECIGDDQSPALIKADRRVDTVFGTLDFVAPSGPAPNFKSKEKDVQKKLFLAAVNYCYTINGFATTRLVGDAANDANQSPALLEFDIKEARRGTVMRKCLQLVAEHTRPDCSGGNDKIKELCKLQNNICSNAKAHGMDVRLFGDCAGGLSYAETRQIASEGCLTNQEYIGLGGTTTASQADVAEYARSCGKRVEAYRSNAKREYDAFVLMVQQLGGAEK